MNKRIFTYLFILVTAIFLSILMRFDLCEKYIGFVLIPMLAAYYLGQYSERKYPKK